MARVCENCGRGTISGVSRSHSNIATKRRLYVNLQTKKINGVRVKICTRCLKTLAKKQKMSTVAKKREIAPKVAAA